MRLPARFLCAGAVALLASCGGGGASNSPPPAPTATLSASPATVNAGASSELTWASTNATACVASGAWSGALAANGSQSTGALSGDASYTVTCSGAGGTGPPASVTITVNPLPSVQLAASPGAVPAGGSSTLSWSSANATGCTAAGDWSGTLAASGSQSTGSLTTDANYSLICAGPGGVSAPASAAVTVIQPAPTVVLSAAPTVVAVGGTSTLTWVSTHATTCTASGAWSGSLPASGMQVSAPLNATAQFSLSCSGAGGSTALVSATVTVSSVTMSIAPQTAPLVLGATKQFTATVPGGVNATWTVDGIPNGNSTVGTITSTGLYAAGGAGTHTIVATSVANAAQTASAVAAVTDLPGVFTYHNDLARDGANVQEYALSPANVNGSSFGKLASCAVDGAVYGQPLWVANVTVGGRKHNVVIVTTQHDSLFAFDADSIACTVLWSASMIDTAHGGTAGETPVPSTAVGVGFGDIAPEIGINGTPVIDPGTGTLYVVAKSMMVSSSTFFQRLHAIDIASGNEKGGSPVAIAGSYPGSGSGGTSVAFSTKQQNQRAALALVNGVVYIAWGSHEDSTPWYGWVMGYQYSNSTWTQLAAFNATPNTRDGGIWMGGGAPPADSSNHLYFITGNGNFDATNVGAPNNDYGDTLLQLNPALQVTQYFTPSDEATDFSADKDFGSGGAAVLADLPAGNTVTHALVCGGKDGTLYVLNRDMLGGFGDAGAVQTIPLGHGSFSTPSMWNNNLYAAGSGGPVHAYQLNQATAQFTSTATSTHSFGFPGSTLSVSAAADQGGVVWAIDNHSYCTQQSPSCGPAVLYAYDAANVTTELWNSSTKAADSAGNAVKFSVPTVANGRVFVGTRGNNSGGAVGSTSTPGELEIYGLTH